MPVIKMTEDELKSHTQKAVEEFARTQTKDVAPMFNIGGSKVKGYDVDTVEGRGIAIARGLRAMAIAKNDPHAAANLVKDWQSVTKFSSDDFLRETLTKGAISPATLATGGIFNTPNLYNEFVEILYPKSVVRQMAGVQFESLPSGSMKINREAGSGITTAWLGDAPATASTNATEPTFQSYTMTVKSLAATAAIQNAELRRQDAGTNIDQKILKIIQRDAGNALDVAYLRYLGGGNAPKGLRGWIASAQQIAMNGTKSIDTITAELTKMSSDVESANVIMESGCYIMSSRSRAYLGAIRNSYGVYAFEELRGTNPTFNGYPVYVTNNIPNNLGGGTESEIYFVDASKIVIGDGVDMQIKIITEGNYLRGGSQVSTSVNDETAFMFLSETDLCLLYSQAGSVLTGVTYI